MEALLLYSRSRDAALSGQPQIAVSLLERAIELDPYRFELRYDLGWAYVNAGGQDDSAIAAFEKAALLQPDSVDLQTELGRLNLAKGNLPAAIAHLRLATQTTGYNTDDGKAAIIDLFLARALKEAGYDRAALDCYGVLLRRFDHPSLAMQENSELGYLLQKPDALFVEIGELLEKHGEYADAIRAFQPAVDREPDNFDLQARFARDLALDEQRDAALEKAVDVVVRNRATPASMAVLRDVCLALHLDDGEVATLKKLSTNRPKDQAVLFALTDTLIANNRAPEAANLLESAWAKAPADIPLTRRLFAVDKQQDQIEAAARLLVHALAVNPDALHNYSTLWAELKRPGLANRLKITTLSAMQIPPGDESALQFWIALTAEDQGRTAVERSALEASIRKTPPFAPAFRAMLNLNWDRPEWSDAQKIQSAENLAAVAKSAGDAALAAELSGRSLVRQNKLPQAVEAFAQAVRLGDRSSEMLLAGINAGRSPGHDPQFEQMLWRLISDRPLYEDGYTTLFAYYADPDTGSLEQAMKVLSTWLVNDPQSISARVAQAQVDIQTEQTHDAEQDLARLFAEDPDDPDVFRVMRQFYTQTGRINELISKLEDERASHPRDTDVVSRLVLLYAGQKRNSEALRLLDATRNAVADDADLLYSLTPLYQELDQKQTADDVLQQVVQLDPAHAGACNDLGFEWADKGKNLPRAEELIRVAVSAEPDNEAFLDSMGWVLYKRGRFDDALHYLRQAIGPAAFPDPAVLDHLGDTLYRLSKTDEACKTWQLGLKGLGDPDETRDDQRQLRQQLQQKIKQAEAKKPVDVSPILSGVPARAERAGPG